MNKEENERVTYEEFMTMFKFAPRVCYTLYDKAEDEIDQLTNNWRLLEEYLKEEINEWSDVDDDIIRAGVTTCVDILDKMKEIKGGNNV